MAIAAISAVLTGGDADASVLDTALSIGRRVGGHISVLYIHVRPSDQLPFISSGAPATVRQAVAKAEQDAEARSARCRSLFDQWQAGNLIPVRSSPAVPDGGGVSTSWVEQVGDPQATIAHAGRFADLIILPHFPNQDPDDAPLSIESALFDSGRPVLLVPPGGPADPSGEAVIGWKECREAVRAITASLPLLRSARPVTVLTATQNAREAAGIEDLLSYLRWHGIAAHHRALSAEGRSSGAMLLAETERRNASFLVMGGYGHPRGRKMVLGGVTQHVLENARLPILIAH